MSDFLTFLVASYATFRLASMLTEDEGPGSALSIMRRKVPAKTNAGRGIRCLRCMSIHCAAIFTGWLWYFGQIEAWATPIYWLGLSGAAITINWLDKK